MIRFILIAILLMVIYQALKTVFRSAVDAYHGGELRSPRAPGEEMVQDPECRTYVVKGRAVARRVSGQTMYFCSTACADAHQRHLRSS